jgi:hypothetical protein
MQSKGSVLIFLAVLAFPVIALSTNHNIFFGVTAALITLAAVKSIYTLLMLNSFQQHELDEELESDLEELIDIDIRKFGDGLSVVINMVVFIIYCAFFLETILLKAIASLAIVFQVHFIINKAKKGSAGFDKNLHKPQILLSSISNLTVVLFTILNKLSRLS